jgi:hypothetical protein
MARLTTSRAEAVAKLVMDGHSLVSACRAAKVSRSVLYQRMGEDAELSNLIKTAQQQSAEKALEDVEVMYQQQLTGAKKYDPNVLRDYALHVRWKVGKVMPDQYGDVKNRAGVEVSDGTVRIVWESDGAS